MTVKVRFAPSPTGRLHVGNIRTALINWLFVKKTGGEFLLRIDDTDTERSTLEFEDGIKQDLSWMGMLWDDTFNQSQRFDKYEEAVERLKQDGLLYACYETPEELDRKRKIAQSRGRPPVYDRAALELTKSQIKAYETEGRKPHWRFKLSGKACKWEDLVRGDQSIDTSSISDPILVRGDGTFLYTLPSVVDDIDADITHVVRGEDHVTNSGAQIEIFNALGGEAPEMAHTPLLVGADGQGLSKRLGSLSIQQLAQDGFEPLAIASLLSKIGTSDPVEYRQSLDQLADEFDFSKIGRAPARFDENELSGLNAQAVHAMEFTEVNERLREYEFGDQSDSDFWNLIKGNLDKVDDAALWLQVMFGQISPQVEQDDISYIQEAIVLLPDGQVDEATWSAWTSALKDRTGRKGKQLFMPLRKAITGQSRGPEMNKVIEYLGRETLLHRLQTVSEGT